MFRRLLWLLLSLNLYGLWKIWKANLALLLWQPFCLELLWKLLPAVLWMTLYQWFILQQWLICVAYAGSQWLLEVGQWLLEVALRLGVWLVAHLHCPAALQLLKLVLEEPTTHLTHR